MTQESASQSLVSMLQGFHIDVSEAERVVDSVNEVANNFPIDTAGIGEALQRSAAAFSAAGTDLNKSIALVTTSNAVVQNPESVGTMFKTMSARIRGAKTELEELGEEEDDYTKTTSKLRDLVKGVTGFDIMKDDNTFKDIYEIILGIGKEWKNLSDIEQASLTEALGGKRGVNTLSAVLNNVDMLEDAYNAAEGASGSAAREQENYAQSVQYSIDRAKASLQQLAVDFMASDFLKGLIETGNTLLKILDQLVNKIGTIPTLLATLGGINFLQGITDPQHGSITTNLISSIFSKNGLLKSLFAGLTGSGASSAVKATSDLAKGVSDGFVQNLAKATTESFKRDNPIPEVLGVLSDGSMVTAVKGYVAPAIEGSVEAAAEAAARRKLGQRLGFSIADDIGSAAVQNAVTGAVTESVAGAVTDTATSGSINAATETVVESGVGGALGKTTGVIATVASALGPVGLTIAGIAAALAAIGGIAYYKHQKDLEALQKQAHEATKAFEESSKQMDDYASQYSSLYEKMSDKDNTDAETLEYKKQIYALQQEIVALYGGQASGIDLVNGDLETQLNLLEQIKTNMGEEDIVKNQKAYDQAEEEMTKTRKYNLSGFGVTAKEGTVGAEIKNIAEQFEKQGIKVKKGAITGSIDIKFEGNARDAYQTLDEFGSKLFELREKYADDDASLYTINQVIDNVDKAQNKVTKITDKWQDAYNSAVTREANKTSNNLLSRYSDAVNQYNEALSIGDAEAKEKAAKEYEEVLSERDKFLAEKDILGISNQEKYGFLFDEVELNKTAKTTSDFAEVIAGINDESQQISKTNMFSPERRNQMQDFASELKDAELNSLDLERIFNRPWDRHHNIPDLEKKIRSLGISFGILSDGSVEDKAKIQQLIDILAREGIIKDPVQDEIDKLDLSSIYSSFMGDMQKEISQLDTINAALVSNFSGKGLSVSWDEESGKIVGDVANIREAYGDLAGYDESKLFARLSTGVKMNVGELRKLRAEQEKITRADFARKQEVMTNALADAYERYNAAKTPLDKQREMQTISNLQQQIKDMRFLESQYDASTSAYQKWLDAQSAGEAGDVYDNVLSTALKRGKELYDTDLLGTEEFRAIAELMSGKDLSSASVQEVVDAYEGFDNTIEGTNHTMRDFLTEGKEGTDRFAESMVDLGFAAKDAEGNISFEDIDIDEMAEKFGTSASLIEAILGKMKDYGWEITFANPDDLGNLDLLDSKINKARESLDKANKSAAKPIVSGSVFDPANLTTVEELDSAISTVQSILSHPSEVGIDNSQAVALQELLDALLEKKQLLESSGGSGVINASSINESFTKLEELKTLLGEYDKLDPSVDVSAFIEGDEQVQELATFIAELPPELKTSLGFDINANTQEIIDSILNGTLYSQANQAAAAMNRANPFDKNGGTSTIREQKIQSVQRTEHNKKENETINKTTEQKREETARIEHTEVTASTSGVEEATEEVKELKEETPEELHSEVTTETHGKKDVEDLNKEEQKAANGASSTVIVSTPGAEKVPQLNNNLAATPDQHTVTLSVVGNGPSTVDAFKRKLDALPAEKRTVITTELRTINTGTHTAGSGGRVTKVNGTANANGTAISRFQGAAHASGNWGTRRRETALMGELGPEILVDGNTGTWHTVGDTGAEFVDVPKGAIIFNHQQTEDLLKHGWVAGRAHVGGTAYGGPKKLTSGKGSNIKKKSGSTPVATGNGGGGNGGGNGGNNNSNSNNNNNNKKKADPQAFDWIERVLNYFQNQFEKFKKLGEYYTTFTYQNAELNKAISAAKDLIKKNETAAEKYESSGKNALLNYTYYDDKGKEKKLTDKYSTKKLNQYWDRLKAETLNGDKYMYIQSIKDENLAKALSEAASYYDKVIDCKNANIDLRHEIMEINRQKLEKIVDDYDHLTSYAEACYNLAVAQNDLYEDWNGIGNLGALTTEAKYQNDIIKETRDEVEELQKELLKQLQDNYFEVGSESWIEAKKKIHEVELQTINAEKQIREINKAIREINWKPFNDAIDVLQHLNSQLDNTISLISDLNGFDDLGVINQNGITMMNLTASALKEARLEVLDYTQGMKNLNKELEGGRISLNDYNEQMRDYQEKQMSAVLEIKKHRDAILSFIKDGINKETEAMSKLIDKRKEALSRQKEADEYAKSVSDKTKEINKIQRQINAMSGDTTQATIAKVKQLTEQLKNAQDELDETRKNHAVDVLTKGLDDEMKAFQERQEERIKILETSLDEQTKAIDLALLHTTEQYGQTTDMLTEIMQTYGFQLESSITEPWKNAKNAMIEYAEATTPLDKLQEKINALKQALAEAKLNVQTSVDDSEIDELQQKIDDLVAEYEIKVNANVDATQLEDLLKQINALQSLLDYKNSLGADTTEVDSLSQQLDTLSSVVNDVNKAVQENTDAISVNTDNYQEVTSVNGDYRVGEEGYNEKGEQQRTVGTNPTVTDASAEEKKTQDTAAKTGDKGGGNSTLTEAQKKANAIAAAKKKSEDAKKALDDAVNKLNKAQNAYDTARANLAKAKNQKKDRTTLDTLQAKVDSARAALNNASYNAKNAGNTYDGSLAAYWKLDPSAKTAYLKKEASAIIKKGKKRASKTVTAAEKKSKSALWQHIVKTDGYEPTNQIFYDLGKLLGVKVAKNNTTTATERTNLLAALKKLGLRRGAFQVGSGGWRLTDEDGIGSEAILTKEGVLRQLDAKDTVFNAKQRETLWNLSKMDFSSLAAIPKSSGGISVTNSYGSLLTVNGNVDRDALPELKEILKQACEYTKKDMLHSMQKKGFR